MESAKQERKNLMKDMPVDRVASGGSWMSKHSQSRIGGSPMKMKEEMKGSPAKAAGSQGDHGMTSVNYGKHVDRYANSNNAEFVNHDESHRKVKKQTPPPKAGEPKPNPNKYGKKSPAKMKSPMEKELVGKQKNLPEALKAKIEAAPEMRYKK